MTYRRQFVIAAIVSALGASLRAQTTSAQTQSVTAADAPEPKRRSYRPPLEGDSYDIGLYEVRADGEVKRPKLVREAREIVAKKDVIFGFVWRVRGYTGTRLVPIRSVVRHPPFKGKTETEIESNLIHKPVNGEMSMPFVFRFDNEDELVPGEWVFSVYYDDKLLVEHAFTIVAPTP